MIKRKQLCLTQQDVFMYSAIEEENTNYHGREARDKAAALELTEQIVFWKKEKYM